MLNVAVCDDEKNIRTYLSSLVKKQGTACEITEYASVEEYLSACGEHDLLFLDIEMSADSASDRNGMWLAGQLRGMELAKQPLIVFVTGYEKYVFDAFDVGAFQYLVKPVDEQKFAEVFKRAVTRLSGEAQQQKKALIVQYANEKRVIPLKDIYYMESRGHKIMFYMEKEKPEYYAKIGELENELRGRFYRIHKGYLINLSHVRGYNRTEVTMANGNKLLISKYKYDGFVKAYMDYLSEG